MESAATSRHPDPNTQAREQRISTDAATDASVSRLAGPMPLARAIGGCMLLAALTLLAASSIHFGYPLALGPVTVHDPFRGAAIPEAVLAGVLVVGSAFVMRGGPSSLYAGAAATLLTLLGVVYGLSVTAGSSRTGDVAYHLGLLALLVFIVVLVLSSSRRQILAGRR